MLCIGVSHGHAVRIGEDIVVVFYQGKHGKRLAIQAPRTLAIQRLGKLAVGPQGGDEDDAGRANGQTGGD